MPNSNDNKNPPQQAQFSENANSVNEHKSEKRGHFWQRVNETMNGINNAIGTMSSIHEKIRSSLGFVKNNILNKSTKQKNSAEDFVGEKYGVKESQEKTSNIAETSANKTQHFHEEHHTYENVSKDVVKKEPKESALETFEKQLQVCSENPEYSDVIKNMIAAELGALKILKSPNSLLLQNFSDLVMEHLLNSYEKIDDEHEKEYFQKNAGLLIRSIINYLQARIVFLEDEETGVQDLIDNAAEDISSVSYFILGTLTANESKIDVDGLVVSPVGGKSSRISIQPKFNQQSIKNACDELRKIKSFRIFARMFLAGKKIQQEKETFYSFLAELFESLRKYRNVFGENNRILAQLIERYGKIIAEEFSFSEDAVRNGLNKLIEKQPSIEDEIPKFPREPSAVRTALIVMGVTLLIDVVLIYAIRNVSLFILWTILIIVVSIIIFVIAFKFADEEYSDDYAHRDWREKVNAWWINAANIYYKALAKSFYDFDKL